MQECWVSVPGKILLAGEYSILEGKQGLAITTGHKLTAKAEKNNRGLISIHSELWKHPFLSRLSDLDGLQQQDPLIDFVGFLVQKLELDFGFDLRIESKIPITAGIGSSSALRLAVAGALFGLRQAYGQSSLAASPFSFNLMKLSWQHQQATQGKASGYDFLVQLTGGVCHFALDFANWPGKEHNSLQIKPKKLADLFAVWVGGQGEPTGEKTLSHLEWLEQRQLKKNWHQWQEKLIDQFLIMLHANNSEFENQAFDHLFQLLDDGHQSMLDSPAYQNPVIKKLMHNSSYKINFSFKTTGAGGRDAILIFAKPQWNQQPLAREIKKMGLSKLENFYAQQGAWVERQLQ